MKNVWDKPRIGKPKYQPKSSCCGSSLVSKPRLRSSLMSQRATSSPKQHGLIKYSRGSDKLKAVLLNVTNVLILSAPKKKGSIEYSSRPSSVFLPSCDVSEQVTHYFVGQSGLQTSPGAVGGVHPTWVDIHAPVAQRDREGVQPWPRRDDPIASGPIVGGLPPLQTLEEPPRQPLLIV